MRSFFVVFLLLCAPALLFAQAAESFPLGTGELGPAPGERVGVQVAASRHGYLAAWFEDRRGDQGWLSVVHCMRLDSGGARIDAESFPISEPWYATTLAVASDGEDYLVVYQALYGITAVRVRDGVPSAPRLLPLEGPPAALGWNGRHYVAVSAWGPMMLLDRDGAPASGIARFAGSLYPPILVCRPGRCLLTGRGLVQTLMLTDGSFPRIGEPPVTLKLSRHASGDSLVAAGSDAHGFYAIAFDDNARLRFLRLFPRLRGDAEPVALPTPPWPSEYEYFTATDGDAIDVVYRPRSGERQPATVLRVGESATAVLPVRANALAANGLLVWTDAHEYNDQFYASRLRDPGATLLSVSRPHELLPRIARGATSLLVSWIERRRDEMLYVRVVDFDGRPLTPPQPVMPAPAVVADSTIAFDGVHYLVVWREWRSPLRARFFSQDGLPVGEAFDVAPPYGGPSTSVEAAWNGSHYVVSTGVGLVRVTAAGVVLDAQPHTDGRDALVATLDASTNTLAALSLAFSGSRVSAGPPFLVHYAAVQLDPSLRVQSRQDRDESAYIFSPAFAAGGGHVLTIFLQAYTYELHLDLDDGTPLPYPPPPYESRAGMRAVWNGTGFLVNSGGTLARHAPDGTYRDQLSLGPGIRDASVVPDGPHAAVVVMKRTTSAMSTTIESTRRDLP